MKSLLVAVVNACSVKFTTGQLVGSREQQIRLKELSPKTSKWIRYMYCYDSGI
jgi:hypothetical protein